MRDVLPVQQHLAARRGPQAHDAAQCRGLAGAVAAQQHGQLAGGHHQVHAVKDVVSADVRVHAGQRQQIALGGAAHAASASGATPR